MAPPTVPMVPPPIAAPTAAPPPAQTASASPPASSEPGSAPLASPPPAQIGDATVAQVLDMTTALDFVESYTGDSPSMNAYRDAAGWDATHTGTGIYAFLPTIKKQGTHGAEFHYRTPNSDVLGWLIARVTKKSPAEVLSERIWSKLGAEKDAYLQVDANGTPLVGTSLTQERSGLLLVYGLVGIASVVPLLYQKRIRRLLKLDKPDDPVAAVVDPLVQDLQERIEDSTRRLHDLVEEGEVGLGQFADSDPDVAIFLEGAQADRPDDLLGYGELREQDGELGPAGP